MYENYNNQYQQENYEQIQHQPKKSKAGKIVALALCCSLLGGIVGAGGTYLFTKATSYSHPAPTIYESSRDTEAINVNHVDTGSELTAAEVYAKNVNSTVGITTSINTNFFGYRTTSAASGSGFILTDDGYIVTNYHVIDGANKITVSTYNGDSYPAEIIGYDEENDLAVLKINASGLAPVTLGNSDSSTVGDGVCAIGNPLGELTFSLTYGVISALDRNVTINGTSMNLIQTDCAINAGNSGGALFNMYGEVIGITNAKLSSSSSVEASIDNIGFAIPIDSVKDMIMSIITDGTVEKPYIGVTITTLGSEYQRFGLSGIVIQSVEEGSPAEKAGLKADDIITAINGEEATDNNDLIKAVSKCSDGETLKLTVTRQGETLEIDVKVEVRTQSALNANTEEPEESIDNSFEDFGWLPGFGSGSPM